MKSVNIHDKVNYFLKLRPTRIRDFKMLRRIDFFKKNLIVAILLVVSFAANAQQKGNFAARINAPTGLCINDGDYYLDGDFGTALLINIAEPNLITRKFDMLWGINASTKAIDADVKSTNKELIIYDHYLIPLITGITYKLKIICI